MAPCQYSWLAQPVVAAVQREEGVDMGKRMAEIGANVAQQIRSQYPDLGTHEEKVEKLAEVMDQLGYSTRNTSVSGRESIIEADNCVFRSLAKKDLAIRHLDRGLMETCYRQQRRASRVHGTRGGRLPLQTQTEGRIEAADQLLADLKAERTAHPFQRRRITAIHHHHINRSASYSSENRNCTAPVGDAPVQLPCHLSFPLQWCDRSKECLMLMQNHNYKLINITKTSQ